MPGLQSSVNMYYMDTMIGTLCARGLFHVAYTFSLTEGKNSTSSNSFKTHGFMTFCMYKIMFQNIRAWNYRLGALDKYNIYLFISSSIEDLKTNQYRKF